MYRIVTVVDKPGSAIDRIAQGMVKYMNGYEYIVCAVHPKRPSPEQIEAFNQAAMGADILDFQYFKSARMLLNTYSWLKDKKKILTHHNPYSITEESWNDFDIVVANNKTIHDRLRGVTNSDLELIGNSIDTDFWTYKREFEPYKQVIMVAARIEAKKGILEVALACQELGIRMLLVGSISDRSYFDSIMATNVVTFHENISDEKLRDLYWNSMLHVCNSIDNFESGTQPILEAMLTGVPVLTRKVGHVPDLDNGENIFIMNTEVEDVERIGSKILEVLGDKNKLNRVREKAWDTAKVRSHERRAWQYKKLYRRLMSDEAPVSVVVPIYKGDDVINACLTAVANQDYQNLEIVVCDDGDNEQLVQQFSVTSSRPVVYIPSNQGDYGLARARNNGIIEASGEIIVFCDQRMIMAKDAVSQFASQVIVGKWLFGNKGGKRNFVENFSCIFRSDIVKIGMFNERITEYGGMSQEIRSRASLNGVETTYLETAKAKPRGTSKNKYTKRQEIIKMKNLLYKVGL